jgi:flagellar motility protein MotE (MotC chaperone)
MTAVKKRPPFARLLPGVMVVGFGLLVLNGSGLVHEAEAGIDQPAASDPLAPPPAPQKDFAGDPAQASSASEVDVLTSLAKRRSELDTREAKIQNEANILAATETRVDAKIAQLKSLQAKMTDLLAQRDAEQEKEVQALVKTYSAMKPQAAARIFESLDDAVLLPVAEEMKSDTFAIILGDMNPDQAQKLTEKLANRLTLPATNDAAAPVPAAPAPAAPPAGAAPAPGPTTQAAGPAKPAPAAQAPAPATPKSS